LKTVKSNPSTQWDLGRFSSSSQSLIAAYVVFWRIIPFIYTIYGQAGLQQADAIPLLISYLSFEVSLCAPLLLNRIGGTATGWTNPLSIPFILNVGGSLIKNPTHLIEPIAASSNIYLIARDHVLAQALTNEQLALRLSMMLSAYSLAQIAYILGYSALSIRFARSAEVRRPELNRMVEAAIIAFYILGISAFLYLINQSGGLLAHFSSLSLGRALVTEKAGTLLAIIKTMPYVLLFWYAVRPRFGDSMMFWTLVICSVTCSFIATGSRSSILIAVLTILLAMVQLKGRLPKFRLALLAVVGTVILGTLGELRQSAAKNSGTVDLGLLKKMLNLQDALGSTRSSTTESDNVRGDLAIFIAVPEEVRYLGGVSYLGSIGFFIPRSIWPEKPRSSGAFVGSAIYERIDDHSRYKGSGYPTGGVAEAFWNFGWLGVPLIFVIFGMFNKLMVGWFLRDTSDPRRFTVYILTLVNFNSPSSETFSVYMQSLFVVAVLSPFVGMRVVQGASPSR
jgi:hypothetical protein